MGEISLSGLRIAVLALVIVGLAGCSTEPRPIPESPAPPSTKHGPYKKPVKPPPKAVRPSKRPPSGEIPSQKARHAEVISKKLIGYQTPAEYLVVRSRYYPDAIAAVSLPIDYEKNDNRYPLVIAFGGAGECARPPKQGALAWLDYYKSDEAVTALRDNILTAADFRNLAQKREVEKFNRRLLDTPYEGVILACPYSPPLRAGNHLEDRSYESYIIRELIPALKARYRVDPNRIGVDGVSMGGARSMYYGLKYPEIFRSAGSLQAAAGPFMEIYEELIHKNREILKHRPIQLVTSDRDPLRPSVLGLSNLFRKYRIPHETYVLSGPHDYIFNQGPGVIALLTFHDRALRSVKLGPVK